MAKTKIHVKRANIDYNKYYGVSKKPVLVIQTDDSQIYGNTVEIKGPSKIVYDPKGNIKGCGSQVWIETESEIEVSWDGGMAEEGV